MYPGSITNIAGIKVGCSSDRVGITGCTAVLFDRLTTAGVDVRGGGPGTINTDVLDPTTGCGIVDCIMLAGGSAFGLGCVDGAMRYLEEQQRGFATVLKPIPMVPGAIIYDLGLGSKDARPSADMAYTACAQAGTEVPQGSYGAGTGATVGKLLLGKGMEKCGQGTAAVTLENGITIGALVVVNALGDVYEGDRILAGLHDDAGQYLDSMRLLVEGENAHALGSNTTIGVVATNAELSRGEVTKLAMLAHDGLAMAIRPVHTLADGDTVFAAATGDVPVGPAINRVLALGAEVMRRAIVNAALASRQPL